MKNDGWKYLTLFWNYVGFITPTTISTVLLINTFNIEMGDDFERAL